MARRIHASPQDLSKWSWIHTARSDYAWSLYKVPLPHVCSYFYYSSAEAFSVGPNNSLISELTQKMIKNDVDCSDDCKAIVSSSSPELAACNVSSTSSSDRPASEFHRNADDFLRLAKWRVDDLSFLVGSDLAIFGTKFHPCISLRLRWISMHWTVILHLIV